MKKPSRYAALANTLLAASAPALAGGAFDGINASVGVGFDSLLTSSAETDPTYYGPSHGPDRSLTTQTEVGQSGSVGKVELGYSRALDGRFNLGVSVFGSFGNRHAGSSSMGGETLEQFTLRPRWGVALEPGYYFGPTSLGYLKLGYASASGRITLLGYDGKFESAGGPLVGTGFKQMLTDRAYLGVEVYRVNYGKAAPFDPLFSGYRLTQSQIHTGLSLGYAFGGTPRAASSAGRVRSFDGFQVAMGLNALSASSRLEESAVNYSLNMAQASTKPSISVGYSHSLPSAFNVTGSIFYAPGSVDAGRLSANSAHLSQVRMRRLVGVTADVGYPFTPGVLGYLKLGYAQASSDVDDRGVRTTFGRTSGPLYGFGFKSMLTSNMFVAVEAAQVDFGRKADQQAGDIAAKHRLNFGGVSLGYVFK